MNHSSVQVHVTLVIEQFDLDIVSRTQVIWLANMPVLAVA